MRLLTPKFLGAALLGLAIGGFAMSESGHAQTVLKVLSAGSLRPALDQIGAAYAAAGGAKVQVGYGPSGVLRQRIEKGEAADLFTSADTDSPNQLARAGKAGPVVLFARNRLCALARPGLAATPDTLLSVMLDPSTKLGTSTPKADPAGDYTWAMFARADAVKSGAHATLEGKSQQLMGGPSSAPPPAGIDLFAWHIKEGRADIFLAYCSAAASFTNSLPEGHVVHLPDSLQVGADYGLTMPAGGNPEAAKLALFILSQDGQKTLAANGFDPPLLTK